MRLCMFRPNDTSMDRGWVGRIDGDSVLHLAAQTLQSYFLGGSSSREHAEYALADVTLLVPVQHPPTVRVFEEQASFAFANASAVHGPAFRLLPQPSAAPLVLLPRLAAVIGAEGRIAGYTLLAEWRAEGVSPPKDRDFALVLGPVVTTADVLDPNGAVMVVRADGAECLRAPLQPFDWGAATDFAGTGTLLRAGDVLAGPCASVVGSLSGLVELELDGIGVLAQTVP